MQKALQISKVQQAFQGVFLGNSLKGKVFRGGAWMGTGSLLVQLTRFGRNMFLARVLAPEAFGTMAIVLSTTSVLASLTDVGTKEALIQNPRGHEDGHVGAAWWLALGRALALYFFLFVTASLIAQFYGNRELTPLLRVAALGVIFEGAMSSRAYAALKAMKFKTWSVINYGGGIAGVITTVILSLFIRDVWALVIGSCSENIFRWIFSYVVCPYRPPLRWDRDAARDLLTFSKGVFGLSLLNLIFARADIFVLAKLYSPTQLGFYAMAVYLIQTPSNFVINVLNQTLMPTFSHIHDDSPRMNRILLQATSCTTFLALPGLVFL